MKDECSCLQDYRKGAMTGRPGMIVYSLGIETEPNGTKYVVDERVPKRVKKFENG